MKHTVAAILAGMLTWALVSIIYDIADRYDSSYIDRPSEIESPFRLYIR